MKILAIETTGQTGSVAAMESGRMVAVVELDPSVRSAVSLAPAIERVLERADWRAADVRLVAVATGPGSFTGLRVGVTTAKMFAYAIGAEVVAVNTLDAIARRVPQVVRDLWVVMDAERNQVIAGRYVRDTIGEWTRCGEPQLLDDEAWLSGLERGVAASGPGLAKLGERAGLATIVDQSLWPATAQAIGELGWRFYQAGQRDDIWRLQPEYYRRSAAEERRGPG